MWISNRPKPRMHIRGSDLRGALLAVLLLCGAWANVSSATLRIALLSTGPEKQTANLMTLAEVRLSQDNRLELLERKAIRTAMEEQKVSLAGLVSADQAVAAGKLLRVEAFACVQSLGPDDPPSLIVFDAFSGARLVDVELPKDKVEAQVDAIAAAVDRARAKLVPNINARTVCLLGVRNADLPRTMDSVCNSTATL